MPFQVRSVKTPGPDRFFFSNSDSNSQSMRGEEGEGCGVRVQPLPIGGVQLIHIDKPSVCTGQTFPARVRRARKWIRNIACGRLLVMIVFIALGDESLVASWTLQGRRVRPTRKGAHWPVIRFKNWTLPVCRSIRCGLRKYQRGSKPAEIALIDFPGRSSTLTTG